MAFNIEPMGVIARLYGGELGREPCFT